MADALKLFGYHHGNNGVSHYRVWQPLKYLAKLGFDVKRIPDRAERLRWQGLSGPCNDPTIGSHEEITNWADVIYTTYSSGLENCARVCAQASIKPLVLDLDDNMLDMDSSNPEFKNWHSNDGQKDELTTVTEDNGDDIKAAVLAGAGKVVEVDGNLCFWQPKVTPSENVIDEIKAAALVTVSTEELKRIYSKHNENVVVAPNGIDFDNFPAPSEKSTDGKVRIVLTGSNSHYSCWKELTETIVKVLNDFPNVVFIYNAWWSVVPGSAGELKDMIKRPQLPECFVDAGLVEHPRVEMHESQEIGDYFKWLASLKADIGLAPLKDTRFNRCRSNIKWLEWAALKVPGVFADLPVYNRDIKHGFNGMLAGNPKEWYSAIKRLVTDAELRKTVAENAYTTAKEGYDMTVLAPKLAKHLESLVGGSENEDAA